MAAAWAIYLQLASDPRVKKCMSYILKTPKKHPKRYKKRFLFFCVFKSITYKGRQFTYLASNDYL